MKRELTKTLINGIDKFIKEGKPLKMSKADVDEIENAIAKEKPWEILDTKLPGFLARVQPSGVISYIVSFRWQGKKNRITIGRAKNLTADQARDKAVEHLAAKTLGIDVISAEKEKKKPAPAPEPEPKPETPDAGATTLESYIDNEYESFFCARHKKNGKATIKRIKSAFADFLPMPMREIDKKKLEKWRTARIEAKKSEATVNRDMTALKSLLTEAVDGNIIDSDPSAKIVPLLELGEPKTRYLSAEEEKSLLDVLDKREAEMLAARKRCNEWREKRSYPLFVEAADALKPMVIVSINTGVRWGSLVNLCWSDVDFDGAILFVYSVNEKSKKNVYIPLNVKVLEELKSWRNAITNEGDDVSDNLIFPGQGGVIKDNANKAWAAVKAKAEIKNFRWHDLRHTFASRLVMAGVDLNTVRELMGHADIKMVLRYAHLSPGHKAAAVAML